MRVDFPSVRKNEFLASINSFSSQFQYGPEILELSSKAYPKVPDYSGLGYVFANPTIVPVSSCLGGTFRMEKYNSTRSSNFQAPSWTMGSEDKNSLTFNCVHEAFVLLSIFILFFMYWH